jgi:hypothetical protein
VGGMSTSLKKAVANNAEINDATGNVPLLFYTVWKGWLNRLGFKSCDKQQHRKRCRSLMRKMMKASRQAYSGRTECIHTLSTLAKLPELSTAESDKFDPSIHDGIKIGLV